MANGLMNRQLTYEVKVISGMTDGNGVITTDLSRNNYIVIAVVVGGIIGTPFVLTNDNGGYICIRFTQPSGTPVSNSSITPISLFVIHL
jgi:hypothetical protein